MYWWLISGACAAILAHAGIFYGFVYVGLPLWAAWAPTLVFITASAWLAHWVFGVRGTMFAALLLPVRFFTEIIGKHQWELHHSAESEWDELFVFGGFFLIPFYLSAALGDSWKAAFGFAGLAYVIQLLVIEWQGFVPRRLILLVLWLVLWRRQKKHTGSEELELVSDEKMEKDRWGEVIPLHPNPNQLWRRTSR
jgi:hypothetical protein